MPELNAANQINVSALCPDNFKIICGTDTPSATLFDDFETGYPVKNFYGLNTEVTAIKFHGQGSSSALLGTYGGTIVNLDFAQNKGVCKLSGHLTSASAL